MQDTETPIPTGATHLGDFYGQRRYYQRVDFNHLNQVSEEWETLTRWNVWECEKWADVGAGFSPRRLQILDAAEMQGPSPAVRPAGMRP